VHTLFCEVSVDKLSSSSVSTDAAVWRKLKLHVRVSTEWVWFAGCEMCCSRLGITLLGRTYSVSTVCLLHVRAPCSHGLLGQYVQSGHFVLSPCLNSVSSGPALDLARDGHWFISDVEYFVSIPCKILMSVKCQFRESSTPCWAQSGLMQ